MLWKDEGVQRARPGLGAGCRTGDACSQAHHDVGQCVASTPHCNMVPLIRGRNSIMCRQAGAALPNEAGGALKLRLVPTQDVWHLGAARGCGQSHSGLHATHVAAFSVLAERNSCGQMLCSNSGHMHVFSVWGLPSAIPCMAVTQMLWTAVVSSTMHATMLPTVVGCATPVGMVLAPCTLWWQAAMSSHVLCFHWNHSLVWLVRLACLGK
jgi:hypothetical protein